MSEIFSRFAAIKAVLFIAILFLLLVGRGETDDSGVDTQDAHAGIVDAGAAEAPVFEPGTNAFETWSLSAGIGVEDAVAAAPDGSVSADRLTIPSGGTAGWMRSDMPISAGDWINGRIWVWSETDTEIVLQLVRWCSNTEAEVGTLAVVATPEPRAYSIWHQFQHAHDCVRFQISAGDAGAEILVWNASVRHSETEPDISEIDDGSSHDSSASDAVTADSAARAWYSNAGIDIDEFSLMPVDERARRLTQAVYAHCTQGPQTVQSLDELFTECVTACGGYSYVLRGLLEATGAQTRYVNLYNVPVQGNHTAVEVFVDGSWAFFDPTFGAFFTRDGEADGPVLRLHEVVTGYTAEDLENLVNQARNRNEDIMSEPLETLFSERFDHASMSLNYYQVAESFSRLDPQELVILDIPLFLNDEGYASIGDFQVTDPAAAEAAWLDHTNRTLWDDDLRNDVSFVSHRLSNSQHERLTTLTIFGVTPGERYELSLVLFGSAGEEVQLMSMGRTAFYGGEGTVSLDGIRTVHAGEFVAIEGRAQFAIRNIAEYGSISVFGVAVRRLENS